MDGVWTNGQTYGRNDGQTYRQMDGPTHGIEKGREGEGRMVAQHDDQLFGCTIEFGATLKHKGEADFVLSMKFNIH